MVFSLRLPSLPLWSIKYDLKHLLKHCHKEQPLFPFTLLSSLMHYPIFKTFIFSPNAPTHLRNIPYLIQCAITSLIQLHSHPMYNVSLRRLCMTHSNITFNKMCRRSCTKHFRLWITMSSMFCTYLFYVWFHWYFYDKTALQIIFLNHYFCPFLTIRFLSNRLKDVRASTCPIIYIFAHFLCISSSIYITQPYIYRNCIPILNQSQQ